MTTSNYNGWSNRETWLINFYFDINSKSDLDRAKESIQEWREELNSFMQEFINFGAINWDELASHVETEEEGE